MPKIFRHLRAVRPKLHNRGTANPPLRQYSAEMRSGVTHIAKYNKVVVGIIAGVAAKLFVVNL